MDRSPLTALKALETRTTFFVIWIHLVLCIVSTSALLTFILNLTIVVLSRMLAEYKECEKQLQSRWIRTMETLSMLMLLVMGMNMKASSERDKNEKPPSRVTSSLGPMGQINRVLLNWRERPVLSPACSNSTIM